MSKAFQEAYGNKFMSAHDLPKVGSVKIVVRELYWSEFKDFKSGKLVPKIVLEFDEPWLPLILNPTNAASIARVLGEDEDKWVGYAIAFIRVKIDVNGQLKDAIRVDEDGTESLVEEPARATPRSKAKKARPGERLYDTGEDDGPIEDLPNDAEWNRPAV
jgi:hypothetical protein